MDTLFKKTLQFGMRLVSEIAWRNIPCNANATKCHHALAKTAGFLFLPP